MAAYTLHTDEEIKKMCKTIGIQSVHDLYADLPSSLILKEDLNIPQGLSEFRVLDDLKTLASQNVIYKTILRGAGAEHHLIPSVVKQMSQREEFVTSYTPYQSELSQGILQSIFEYQTSICELTGMDVSNASIYDGASAAAEAISMVIEKTRHEVLIPANINPHFLTTIQTYTQFQSDIKLIEVKVSNGVIDEADLKAKLNEQTAGIVLQNPNYFGQLEDVEECSRLAHSVGAKMIAIVNPFTLGLLKSPRASGVDIAVGEAQVLGIPLSFGGPYLGFMAASSELTRRIPGRIVGQTLDKDGQRSFALTLQAREQHIRREKASSSLCSNQALMALVASIYLSSVGPDGLAEVGQNALDMSHYFVGQMEQLGFRRVYTGPYFHEVVLSHPQLSSSRIESILEEYLILSGYPMDDQSMLWCITEAITKEQCDEVIQRLGEAL